MNPIIPIIRIATYLVGAIIGISSGQPLGLVLGILLLANAVIVYMIDRNDQVSEDIPKAKDKALDLIGFQLGIPRKEYSIAGMKVKEMDGTYRKRMRDYLKGVTPPRGL